MYSIGATPAISMHLLLGTKRHHNDGSKHFRSGIKTEIGSKGQIRAIGKIVLKKIGLKPHLNSIRVVKTVLCL